MRVRCVLVRQQDYAPRTQIQVIRGERLLVERGEVIQNREAIVGRAKMEQGIAVVGASGVSVKGPIAGSQKNCAVRIRHRPTTGLPDGPLAPVRSSRECSYGLQAAPIVSQQPPVVGIAVASVAAKRDVNRPVLQQQRRTLHLDCRIELQSSLARRDRGAEHRRRNHIGSRGDAQCVQAVNVGPVLQSLCHNMERACQRVDDRGA